MCLASRARTEIDQDHGHIAGIAHAVVVKIGGAAWTRSKIQQRQREIAAADNAITVYITGASAQIRRGRRVHIQLRRCGVRAGVEHCADSSGNPHVPQSGGAESGALAAKIDPQDPDLADLLAAWPKLPEALRTGILAMVRASSIRH